MLLCQDKSTKHKQKKEPKQKNRDKSPSNRRVSMARGSGTFFMATLIIWVISILYEILINNRTQLIPIILGFIFYQSANWVIRISQQNHNPLFVNTCVSLLHSFTTSTSVLFILTNQFIKLNNVNQMFEHSQLVEHTWPYAFLALCFSSGYFAYDQLDMLIYRLYSGFIPSILVHHFLLLVCFTLALYRNVTINYLILTLICELHSVFLHTRKVRRMAGFRDSTSVVVKVEWVLNWTSFVLARVVSHVLITVKLIRDADKFDKGGVELPLALFGMAGMNLLNVFLGIDLFKAYRREMYPQRSYQNHQD
ncbi:uncharacterized protein LOC132063366 [Lycium ferocissimum]|uniref:uncharacterized protein LOC132063366 n=1 Tax=Lycium ferocissimum TaxID=112874 RepID=UPI00281566C9|nr:uncharacterized protein LOC132063366 [Lycium ferocissimum]